MSDRTNPRRDWSSAHHARSQLNEQLDTAMHSILKLFAGGCLVYRCRDLTTPPVLTQSDRLRRVRAALPPAAPSERFPPHFDGGIPRTMGDQAAVA